MKFLENSKSLRDRTELPAPIEGITSFPEYPSFLFGIPVVGYLRRWVFPMLGIPYSYPLYLQQRRSRNGTHSELLNKFVTYMQPEDPDSEQDTFSK